MKIVISNPPWPGSGYGVRSNSRWPHRRGDKILTYPIYLAYTSAILEQEGFNVFGIDAVQKEMDFTSFIHLINKIDPEIVVLETSTPSINYDLRAAKEIKENVDATTVLIGPHSTVFHESLLRENEYLDIIIRGEFDYAVRDIALNLRESDNLEEILGISYRKKGKVYVNEKRPHIKNLDELPYPARDIFQIDDYNQGWYLENTAMMITSRGCPFKCTFCLWPQVMYGRDLRLRSSENILDEIEYLIERYNIKNIDFDDDTFTVNKRRLHEICTGIIERGLDIKWRCFSKADIINKETLTLMKKSGAYYICYGIESGSPEILNNVRKNIKLDDAKKAVKMSMEMGLKTHATFMFGLPGESKETVEKTINFAKELCSDTVQFSICMPYPGTELFNEMKERNYLKYNSFDEFDGCHGSVIETKEFTKKEFMDVLSKAYMKYYIRFEIIKNKIKVIRSVEDIKLLLKGTKTILNRINFYK